MYKDEKEKSSSRDKLIAALELEIEKQNRIIKVQEDTIRILSEQNDEFMRILDRTLKQ